MWLRGVFRNSLYFSLLPEPCRYLIFFFFFLVKKLFGERKGGLNKVKVII